MQPVALAARLTRLLAAVAVVLSVSGNAVLADGQDNQSASLGSIESDGMVVKRIGLIDIEGVLRASTGTIKVRELLDAQRLSFQKEIGSQEVELQQTERALLAQQDTLSQEEFNAQLEIFQDKVTVLQKQIQYRRQALDVAFQDAQRNLRSIALDIVKEIANERNLDLVLVRDSALIFLPSLNISDEVLARLNERTKNARVEIITGSEPVTE